MSNAQTPEKKLQRDMKALLAFVRRGCSGVTPIPEEMLPELTGALGAECARAIADCELFTLEFRARAEEKLFEVLQELEDEKKEMEMQ